MSKEERGLAAEILSSSGADTVIKTSLSTNQRVIARVTDGIYRQPGSALRELVSNAYDADATVVTIKTDAPRFEKITIEDDGVGMSPQALAHLLKNIGGSAKRTDEGVDLGVTGVDANLSPGGRPLIGKLGIGLFSVSQLTRAFQIITKVSGDQYRTVAHIKLRQFSDDESLVDGADYDAGEVLVWREATERIEEHGTTIVLTSIRPQTRESLQSRDIWDAIDNPVEEDPLAIAAFIPKFHIGRADAFNEYLSAPDGSLKQLPWDSTDAPQEAFQKMVDSVWDVASRSNPNPKLSDMFDNYLRMIWDLSLALPLPYVRGNLFDEPSSDWAQYFLLSNEGKRSVAREVQGSRSQPIRKFLDLEAGQESTLDFEVFVDELKLLRPLRFRDLPNTSHALKTPLVFLGHLREEFEGFSSAVSTGPLEFEAYFFWTPKIAPVNHRGALIRIHNSSGSLFDDGFFRYQVSEQNRLRQITCEIFVKRGLEAALNIDRETFNMSHPHMVVLTKWVHNALRQVASSQKRVAKVIRDDERAIVEVRKADRLRDIVEVANQFYTDGEGVIPNIQIRTVNDDPDTDELHENVVQRFNPEVVFRGVQPTSFDPQFDDRIAAIAQVLSIYGVFEHLTHDQGEELMFSLAEILRTALE